MKELASVYRTYLIRPGDDISLWYRSQKVIGSKATKEMVLGKAVVFEVEEGDFEGIEEGIGGMFVRGKA